MKWLQREKREKGERNKQGSGTRRWDGLVKGLARRSCRGFRSGVRETEHCEKTEGWERNEGERKTEWDRGVGRRLGWDRGSLFRVETGIGH